MKILLSSDNLSEFQIKVCDIMQNNMEEFVKNGIFEIPFVTNNELPDIIVLERETPISKTSITIEKDNVTYTYTPIKMKIIGKIVNNYTTFDDNFDLMVKCFLLDTAVREPQLKGK